MILWKNGIFHTMRQQDSVCFNVLTQQGKIIAVNVDENLYQHIEQINLKGQHVYPGLVDAHLHLIGYGQKLARTDLSLLPSKDQILALLKSKISNSILIGVGYHDVGITKTDLDSISNDEPIILIHNDYHSLTANSKALILTNVQSDHGILTEEEAKLVISRIITYDQETLEDYLLKAIRQLHEYGIVGGHSDDLSYFGKMETTYQAIEKVLSATPFRAHLLIHQHIFDKWCDTVKTIKNPYLEYGAVKLFYDGTLSSKTALIYGKYRGIKQHGITILTNHQFREQVAKARQHGYTVAIHVIGDRALDEVGDVLKDFPPQPGQLDRIIHASLARKETLIKLAKLPIILDIQPSFVTTDMPYMNQWLETPSELTYAWKSYLDAKLILFGSSDAPVENPNPLWGIHAAETRQYGDHQIADQDECLTRFEALKMYTTNYAIITNEYASRGYLDVGYFADFTIYEDDLLKLETDRLLSLKPSMTVVDEKIVFKTIS